MERPERKKIICNTYNWQGFIPSIHKHFPQIHKKTEDNLNKMGRELTGTSQEDIQMNHTLQLSNQVNTNYNHKVIPLHTDQNG